MKNKKVKQSMRDHVEYWTCYHCENSSYERYVSVCNRAIGLFKPNLKFCGVVSLTADQLRGK
ncbi:hypothetical protein NVP1198B_71 [Vibrio phage 1.198.B._10N.286.54.F4]|nr:hypothetical protein NVP1198A_72 [Vibrio phage 1.198.A._10N.286.54.F4]AUR94859.1 hypothetical protein NVP1198B_71 [Vibrio phage 1.198.B._10N.286.54.F4]